MLNNHCYYGRTGKVIIKKDWVDYALAEEQAYLKEKAERKKIMDEISLNRINRINRIKRKNK